jgi:hypothetical protein
MGFGFVALLGVTIDQALSESPRHEELDMQPGATGFGEGVTFADG